MPESRTSIRIREPDCAARKVKSPAIGHGIDCIGRQRYDCLLQLTSIAENYGQVVGGFNFDLDVVTALLMSNQASRGFDQITNVDRHSLAGAQATEVQQAIGYRFAAKCFIANQAEILAQILGIRRIAKRTFFNPLLEGFRTGCDSCQRIVDLMHYACRQAADGGQFFGASDCAMRFHPGRNIFADGDHVRNLVGLSGAHGNLANQPMIRIAILGDCLLFDAMNLAGGENIAEFAFKELAALFGQHVENAFTQRLRPSAIPVRPVRDCGSTPQSDGWCRSRKATKAAHR